MCVTERSRCQADFLILVKVGKPHLSVCGRWLSRDFQCMVSKDRDDFASGLVEDTAISTKSTFFSIYEH